MDLYNINFLKNLAPDEIIKSKISLLSSFLNDKRNGGVINDPYGSPPDIYELTFQQCWESCENFLKSF